MSDPYMKSDTQSPVSLREITDAVWSRREPISIIVIAMIVLSAIYLHIAEPIYTATLNVSPVLSSTGSLSKRMGGLSDLASAAGIGLPQSQGEMQFELYVESLQSYAVADELSARTDLMRRLYPKEWDDTSRRWRDHVSVTRRIVRTIKLLLGIPVSTWQPPNGVRLQRHLKDALTVDQSPKRLMVTISYQNHDPAFAVDFLQALHKASDNALRRKALERATQYATYLQNKLSSVTVDDYRNALTTALTEQEKARMAASSTTSFAAEPFGKASVSALPTSPNALLVLIGAAIVGIFAGILGSILAAAGMLPWFDSIRVSRIKLSRLSRRSTLSPTR